MIWEDLLGFPLQTTMQHSVTSNTKVFICNSNLKVQEIVTTKSPNKLTRSSESIISRQALARSTMAWIARHLPPAEPEGSDSPRANSWQSTFQKSVARNRQTDTCSNTVQGQSPVGRRLFRGAAGVEGDVACVLNVSDRNNCNTSNTRGWE